MVGQNGSTCRGGGTGRFCAAIAVVSNTRATARAGGLFMTPDDTRWGQPSEAGQVVDQQLAPGLELTALHEQLAVVAALDAHGAPVVFRRPVLPELGDVDEAESLIVVGLDGQPPFGWRGQCYRSFHLATRTQLQ